MKRKTNNWNKKAGFFISLLLLLIIFIVYSRITLIKEISCTNQYGACSHETLRELNKFTGENYFSFKKKVSKYLNDNYGVTQIRFHYILFNKAQVYYVKESATYALKNTKINKYLLIGESGKILSIQDSTALPFIKADLEKINVGQSIDKQTHKGLNLLMTLYSTHGIKEGELIDDAVKIYLPEGVSVIFPLDEEVELAMGKLQFIMAQLQANMESNEIIVDEIDLRYDNPIIR